MEGVMFEHLKQYRLILVTGPLRSGTTICGRMVAHDTGHTYIDENEWGAVDLDRFHIAAERHNVVIQCPGLMYELCHESPVTSLNSCFTIVMWRSPMLCRKSIERYTQGHVWAKRDARHVGGLTYDEVAFRKYTMWLMAAPEHVRHWKSIPYDSLSLHPLWKDERKHWGPKRWR
jgi:hypothetical protein